MHTEIKMAGLTIAVEHNFKNIDGAPKKFKNDGDKVDFTVSVTEDDIAFERVKMAKEEEAEGLPARSYSSSELEFTAIYRKIAEKLPEYDAFVFHGAVVAVGDEAYIFAAKSGVGKTTHIGLWLKNVPNSFVVDGDKPIIRLIENKPFVCGTPWNGKEKLGTNAIVPLKAICLLARGKENCIEKIPFSEALPVLIEQSYRPTGRKSLVKTLSDIKTVGLQTDFYKLYCNMDDEAAIVSYGEMANDEF
ncbi:MAG: hypothetical protein KBS44_07575 [Clostridiales bacterium]|nr:hypothetical protein [Candidatus Coliplasma equi]